MIEIEKKFLLTAQQQQRLLQDARLVGQKLVEDTYLDTGDHRLSLNDFWFRKRDGTYELKAPLKSGSGSYEGTNRYNEITDEKEIAYALNIDLSEDFEQAIQTAGIALFVTCYTDRTSYEKAGFHIDIDSATYADTDFTYAIAEIELLIEDEAQAEEADRQIIAFASQQDLTIDTLIIGKIGAYLREERPDHYAALADANILK